MSPNRVFSRIERPATRGEVAIRILQDILPKSVTKNRKDDESELSLAKKHYDKMQKATEAEIAISYLPQDYGWNQQALSFLMKKTENTRIPEFEGFLLQKENMDHYNFSYHLEQKAILLAQYVALRGSEAQVLVEKFAQVLREQSAEYQKPKNTSYGGAEQDRAEVTQQKAKILSLAESVATLQAPSSLEELLARPESSPYKMQMLTMKLNVIPHSEALGILLRRAIQNDSPETLNMVHALIRSVLIEGDQGHVTDVKPSDHAKEWGILVSKNKNLLLDCEILFAGPLANPPKRTRRDSWNRNQSSVGVVSSALCAEYGPLTLDLIQERVRSRLAGIPEENLPKYPCDRPLSATEIAMLQTKFEGATSRESAQKIAGKLSLYERVALPEVLRQSPELNARLLKFSNLITAVNLPENETKLQEKFAPFKNTEISLEMVRSLETLVRTEVEAGRSITCVVARHKDFAGSDITVKREPLPNQGKKIPEIVGYSGFVCGLGVYNQATWRMTALPKKIEWYMIRTSEPMDLEAFGKALAQFVGTGMPASGESFLRFMAKGESQE